MEKTKPQAAQEVSKLPRKRVYASPALRRFGSLTEVTNQTTASLGANDGMANKTG